MAAPINTFIIYAREDEIILQDLVRYLNAFQTPQYNMFMWYDEYIKAGQEWEEEIKSKLQQTDIFILLLSSHFLASEFISKVEIAVAIDRYKQGRSIVIPVIARPCQWHKDIYPAGSAFSLKKLNVLPDGAKSIIQWNPVEEGLNNVADGIGIVLESFLEKEKLKQAQEEEEKRQKEQQAIKLEKETEEDTAWQLVLTNNDRSSYTGYLANYPAGRHSSEALQKINEYNAVNEEEKKKADNENEKILWEEVKKKNKITDYNRYLKSYPKGKYKNVANDKIDELTKEEKRIKRKEAQQMELDVWNKAMYKNTPRSYEIYLKDYPSGKFAAEALENINNLKDPKPQPQSILPPRPGNRYEPRVFKPPTQRATPSKPTEQDNSKDFVTWLLVPVTIALCLGAIYIGNYLFITMYQWSGIEWVLHPLPNLLLIITACVWGLTFGLLGMDSTPRFGPIAELFKPYAKFFKERSFIVALFASPVINIFVTQIILTAVDYLLGHYMAWHSNATSIILFITINVAAFIFYADD